MGNQLLPAAVNPRHNNSISNPCTTLATTTTSNENYLQQEQEPLRRPPRPATTCEQPPWSFSVHSDWSINVMAALLAGGHPRCGAASPARPMCACPHLVRLVVCHWLRAVTPRFLVVLDLWSNLVSHEEGERALNSVAFMAEVAPGAPGGGACCCGGVMGGPRLCESERFSWVDARRNVVVEQPEEWERRACVVDTVTGQREDLGVVGVGEVLSNGRWAVIRSVQGRVWVAKVNAYCRHAAGHHHNRVPLIGDRVEINQEGISELPLREKFVSENVMCRLSEGPGEMLFCVLYDVGMSFATGKWVALDCVTFRDVRGVTTIQVSFCWERRALLGEKYDRQQNRLFTVDESGARLTLQTRPGSPILILDSYFVVLPSSEQHKKGMHTAEVWSFKDLSRQHCYFEVPTGSWVSACAGRCSDFLAILPPATGVPSGGTELHFIDVSCGMTLFTIHAHSGLSLLPPYSFGKVLWIAPTATTL